MPICSYRWGRFIPLRSRLQPHFFFLHKWLCGNAVLSLSDSATHLAVQMTRGTLLMPLIFKAPTWLVCVCIHLKVLAVTIKLFTTWTLRILHSLVAEQNVVVTRWTGGHCAATVRICLLLTQWSCTMSIDGRLLLTSYHGKERSKFTASVAKIYNCLLFYMTYCVSKSFSSQNLLVVLTNTLNNIPRTDTLIQTSITIINKKEPSLPSSKVPILIKSPFASLTHTASILHKLMKVLPGYHKPW